MKLSNLGTILLVLVLNALPAFAGSDAAKILKSFGRETGVFVVIGAGEPAAPALAADLGRNGNSLVHAIASSASELAAFKTAIAEAQVKGCVSAEQLPLSPLPYRDYAVNVLIIADQAGAQKLGLTVAEARRCVAPYGRLVICRQGKVSEIEKVAVPGAMDVWTHRYHKSNGIPVSKDRLLNLPVGFKWNAGLPMNFNNPKRAANRYSSVRGLVVGDGCCFSFSTAVVENLGATWKSEYGTDQYLTCRDAFNGRLIWRTRIGNTYYGGLYIENLAPLVLEQGHIYTAGENGKMLCISAKTGKIVRELPTTFIPGVINASNGVIVAACWKNGKQMGSVLRYDRRRMDWDICEGTLEAYDAKTGRELWKQTVLGTSMLIDDGRVFIVNRTDKDELEKNHNRQKKGALKPFTHPPQAVMAFDLKKGTKLWRADDASFNVTGRSINLEAAGYGSLAVAYDNRKKVALLSALTGKLLDTEATKRVESKFFRYRNHICTPVLRTQTMVLCNRGCNLRQGNKSVSYGGARGGCLTGTVPAYGAGYIPQNWCKCAPGQIPGLLAICSIGKMLTPAEMEKPVEPTVFAKYNPERDGVGSSAVWTSFRGNAQRSSSVACTIPQDVSPVWTKKIVADRIEGTVARDWRSFLNSRLTPASIAGGLAIVGDIDHNEIIAADIATGDVKWRYMTAGRFDTPPTVYKGICLIGDRTGYVHALKVKTGELIYRLRIAPQEKRMVSYGKVESVWPVVGGILVTDGKAYVSAGRTQGSDGGLVVRAFVPETGKHVWSKCIPQSGRGVSGKPKRNDALARCGDLLVVMGHRLKLTDGSFVPDMVEAFFRKAEADAAKKKGSRLSRKEKNELRKKLAGEAKKIGADPIITTGLEGIYSWNWTRLGHRKFGNNAYGEFKGDTFSWNDKCAAVCEMRNRLNVRGIGQKPAKSFSFTVPANRQVTSLVLCNNVVLMGGVIDKGKATPAGFVQAINLEDGKPVWDKTFKTKLAFNGLAVDNSTIIVTFDDGSVVCLK